MRDWNVPIWNREFGPVYPSPSEPNADATNCAHMGVLTEQLKTYRASNTSWNIWLYKDIGYQGMKKQALGLDFWGCTDKDGVKDIYGPFIQGLKDRVPAHLQKRKYPPVWTFDRQVERMVRECLLKSGSLELDACEVPRAGIGVLPFTPLSANCSWAMIRSSKSTGTDERPPPFFGGSGYWRSIIVGDLMVDAAGATTATASEAKDPLCADALDTGSIAPFSHCNSNPSKLINHLLYFSHRLVQRGSVGIPGISRSGIGSESDSSDQERSGPAGGSSGIMVVELPLGSSSSLGPGLE
ncbi:hypothetical protein BBP40_002238 [Aspergillus hancockii]|nr:hypothetical protein BBP40_002238 [Aspergillus hancockii]